jgi:hypothetical protein
VGSHTSRTPLLWGTETPLLWSFGVKPYSLKTRNFLRVIRNATFVALWWEALLSKTRNFLWVIRNATFVAPLWEAANLKRHFQKIDIHYIIAISFLGRLPFMAKNHQILLNVHHYCRQF